MTTEQVYFAEGHRTELNEEGQTSVAIVRRETPIYAATREQAKEEAMRYFRDTEGPNWDGEIFVYDKDEVDARRQIGLWP